MISNYVLGYVLAVSVGVSGPTGARLKNTGQLSSASIARPVLTLLLTVLYGASGIAAVLYFSWAHLTWQHILAFFAAWLTLGGMVAGSDNRLAVWSAFVVSVLAAVAVEMTLIGR